MDSSNCSSTKVSNFVTSGSNSPQSDALQQLVSKILKSRIFLGRYVERRLVNELIGYRDIVVVSTAEEELQRDFVEVVQKLFKHYPATHWIGITDTENLSGYKASICLWTEIDDKPFGPFWFQIKSVQFRTNEILVQLKCLRHITDRFLEMEPFLVRNEKSKDSYSNNSLVESLDLNEIMVLAKNTFTLRSIKDSIFFLIAIMIGIVTGSFAFVSYLGTFVLSLLRESSNLIHNSTPLLLGCLDFLSKIVGGFYILIAMIFRPSSPKRIPDRCIEYDRDGRSKSNNPDYDEMKYFD